MSRRRRLLAAPVVLLLQAWPAAAQRLSVPYGGVVPIAVSLQLPSSAPQPLVLTGALIPMLPPALPSLEPLRLEPASLKPGFVPVIVSLQTLGVALAVVNEPGGTMRGLGAIDRFYSGSAPAEPPSAGPGPVFELGPGIDVLKADVVRLLDYVAGSPTRRQGKQAIAGEMLERLRVVRDHVGIPREVPDGWFTTKTIFEPISPELIPAVRDLAETVALLRDRPLRGELWSDGRSQFLNEASDLLYSFGKLAQRAESSTKLFAELDWLYGTYRLGQPRRNPS